MKEGVKVCKSQRSRRSPASSSLLDMTGRPYPGNLNIMAAEDMGSSNTS